MRCVSLGVCICVYMCMIANQSTRKKNAIMSDLSKLDVLTPLSCTQIPRLDMCRSILSLSKMIQQLWCNHPLSQRNKTIKKVVGMEVAGDG